MWEHNSEFVSEQYNGCLQISVCLFRKHKEMPGLFLEIRDEWNEIETVQCIIKFITDLCVCGITVEQGDYMLLHESLRFFEMVRTVKCKMTMSFCLQKPEQLGIKESS
jgi:hypothetical protein